MRSRIYIVAIAMVAVATCVPPAAAQFYRRSPMVSRPSEQGASSLLGGRYTRAQGFAPLMASRSNVALLGENRFQFMRRPSYERIGFEYKMLPAARVGLYRPLTAPGGYPLSADWRRTGDLTVVSGLNRATSLSLPLPGYSGGLPALNAFAYTPGPEPTPFSELFGLTPSAARESPAGPQQTFAERLEEQTRRRVDRAKEDGVALFKQATIERRDPVTGRYPNCRDCGDKLARAVQKLTLVRDLDDDAYLPSLLMAHAALERAQPMLATAHLLEAFQRNPELFDPEADSLSQYFGDAEGEDGPSATLRAQMERFVQTGRLNPTSAEAHLLAAYCAWQLGDTARAREAAELAASLARQEIEADPQSADRVLGFAAGIQAAFP